MAKIKRSIVNPFHSFRYHDFRYLLVDIERQGSNTLHRKIPIFVKCRARDNYSAVARVGNIGQNDSRMVFVISVDEIVVGLLRM